MVNMAPRNAEDDRRTVERKWLQIAGGRRGEGVPSGEDSNSMEKEDESIWFDLHCRLCRDRRKAEGIAPTSWLKSLTFRGKNFPEMLKKLRERRKSGSMNPSTSMEAIERRTGDLRHRTSSRDFSKQPVYAPRFGWIIEFEKVPPDLTDPSIQQMRAAREGGRDEETLAGSSRNTV